MGSRVRFHLELYIGRVVGQVRPVAAITPNRVVRRYCAPFWRRLSVAAIGMPARAGLQRAMTDFETGEERAHDTRRLYRANPISDAPLFANYPLGYPADFLGSAGRVMFRSILQEPALVAGTACPILPKQR